MQEGRPVVVSVLLPRCSHSGCTLFILLHEFLNPPWPHVPTMSRHFLAAIDCDIPSVTSHLAAYLLLGSLGKREDQCWPICLFSCQSGKLIPP